MSRKRRRASPYRSSRLTARIVSARSALGAGLHLLPLPNGHHGLLAIPERALAGPAPLVVLFHGAGGNAQKGLDILKGFSARFGLILFAPRAARSSWDFIHHDFGEDLFNVDFALDWISRRCFLDPRRVTCGGFSDGASYALALGLSNGNIFSRIMAFSPGFIAGNERRGKPRIFISHGSDDPVLPIQMCGRVIVDTLSSESYPVTFCQFPGGHSMPREIKNAAMQWLISSGEPRQQFVSWLGA